MAGPGQNCPDRGVRAKWELVGGTWEAGRRQDHRNSCPRLDLDQVGAELKLRAWEMGPLEAMGPWGFLGKGGWLDSENTASCQAIPRVCWDNRTRAGQEIVIGRNKVGVATQLPKRWVDDAADMPLGLYPQAWGRWAWCSGKRGLLESNIPGSSSGPASY